MRLNLGIRRRLAPLVDNDRRQIELLYSLLLTLPGSPIIYYGDEIGMGDNIYLGDRNGVRTPMQWTGDRNAGFSRADPSQLYQQVLLDPVSHYQAINVEAQLRSPTSLLQWLRRLIRVRKKYPVFGRGTLKFIPCENRRVVAYLREYQDQKALVVINPKSKNTPALAKKSAGTSRAWTATNCPKVGRAPPNQRNSALPVSRPALTRAFLLRLADSVAKAAVLRPISTAGVARWACPS